MTAIVRALILLLLLAGGTAVRAQNLLTNGNFDAGLAGWSTWTAPPGFWDGTWIHSNDCDIWVPTQCPFGGAGTTLIAAERTGRRAHLIEIDPGYVDVTVQRWERLTGKKAVRMSRANNSDDSAVQTSCAPQAPERTLPDER